MKVLKNFVDFFISVSNVFGILFFIRFAFILLNLKAEVTAQNLFTELNNNNIAFALIIFSILIVLFKIYAEIKITKALLFFKSQILKMIEYNRKMY